MSTESSRVGTTHLQHEWILSVDITLYILQVSVSRTDCRLLLHDSVFTAVSALAVATVIFTAGSVQPTLVLLPDPLLNNKMLLFFCALCTHL